MPCLSLPWLCRRNQARRKVERATSVASRRPRSYDKGPSAAIYDDDDDDDYDYYYYDDDYDDDKSRRRRVSSAGARAPLPRGVAVRTNVNPSFSAYAAPLPPSDGRQASSSAADVHGEKLVRKLETDGAPETELRRRSEDQARQKAEEEEQERLDFFQLM